MFFSRGAPIRIFEADHRSHTDTQILIFLSWYRIIYSDDPIKIFWHLFRAWISFLEKCNFFILKMNSPLRWLLWEGIFLDLRGGGGILDIFKKYIFSLPKWSCTAFLFWQSCNCCTIAYTQHKPDFMSCIVCEVAFYTRFTHTPSAVRMQSISGAEAARTVLSHGSLQLIRGCLLQTQHLSIILISNPNIVTENAFSALWFFFFLLSTVIQSFIDVFKGIKYKKHIIQCFYFCIYF